MSSTEIINKIGILPSVVLFGAEADGITDDTVAIQDAITAGSIFIPKGVNQASALQVLTCTGTFSNGETIVIGTTALSKTYTMKTALASANDVLIGANLAASLTNLAAAVNGSTGIGTTYGTGTLSNMEVTAVPTATTLTITSIQPGSAGNLILTTETAANASWGASACAGGVDSYIVSNEILVPSNRQIIVETGTVFKEANSSNATGQCLFFRNVDYVGGNSNIFISGGIFDGNNTNNSRSDSATSINGVAFRFVNVTGLVLRDIQVRNTQTFGFQVSGKSIFAENLYLNSSVPSLNQDGFHINGPSSNIRIKNLTGNPNDDLIAVNADGPDPYCVSRGDVTDVVVDGMRCLNGLNVGRLLASGVTIKDFTLKNVSGRTSLSGFEISSFGLPENGTFENITFENWEVAPTTLFIKCTAPVKSLFLNQLKMITNHGVEIQDSMDLLAINGCTHNFSSASFFFAATGSLANIKLLQVNNCSMKYTGGAANAGVFIAVTTSGLVQKAIITGCYTNKITYFARADAATISNLQAIGNYLDVYDTGIIAYPNATITNLVASSNIFKSGAYAPFAVANSSLIVGAEISDNLLDTVPNFYIFSGTIATTPQRVLTSNNKFISVTNKFIDIGGTAAVVSVSGLDILQPVSALAQTSGDTLVDSNGNLLTSFAGKTLAVRSGTNAKAGTFTLVAGTVTVSNTAVTANSVIKATLKTLGGTQSNWLKITPTASTGFTVVGENVADTGTYNFTILEVS